jgi:hypothetical protein
MVEVTVWMVVACQSKGGSDVARQASGAGLALACRTGEPVGQAQPEEREGGALVLETRGARGGRRPGGQPKEEKRGRKIRREKEKGEKRKRKRKGKREKRNKKKENKRRKIEKRFRKLGEISRKIRREVKKDFCGFSWVFGANFRDGGDGEADRPAGPRRCGIPFVVADSGAGAARTDDGPSAGGAGGIRGMRAEGERENDRGFERGK